MKKIFKAHHPARHIKSVRYAFSGIFHTLVNEPNFRVQILIALSSVVLGIKFKIDNTEWGLLILSTGLLLFSEMVNTVVENFIDALVKDYNNGAKIIKDVSAGFVLMTAFTNLAIFLLIFGHRLIVVFSF